jgi:2-aminoethylphosphonate-pyruvate transaminase
MVRERNDAKLLFTAGPASLVPENLTGLRPCFGRGDNDYAGVEEQVLAALKSMTGHARIARMQGSASLALEIVALNFLCGRVLVVATGYYSDRLKWLAESALRRGKSVKEVTTVGWTELESVGGHYDWLLACSTETSRGLMLPIQFLSSVAKRVGARLAIDATASIGLESGHELADVVAYSSCKGLFGLTGASFIAFDEDPGNEVDSFYLSLATHLEKRMTGPYHAIASLVDVLPRHDDFKAAVRANKAAFVQKMNSWLTVAAANQPLLCTHVSCEINSRDPRSVLYKPRNNPGGSVVCHLGEIHLERKAEGRILTALEVSASQPG